MKRGKGEGWGSERGMENKGRGLPSLGVGGSERKERRTIRLTSAVLKKGRRKFLTRGG